MNEQLPFTSHLIEPTNWREQNPTMQEIYYLQNNPEIIVRMTPKNTFHNENGRFNYQEHLVNKEVLTDLRERYGLSIPQFYTVIGGDNRILTITERIHGQNLQDKLYASEEIETATLKLSTFYSSLADVLINTSEQGGPMIADLTRAGGETSGNKQWVYGKRKGETEENIWLVDLGPAIHQFQPRELLFFQKQFNYLFEMIVESENKVGEQFTEARERILTYLQYIRFEQTNSSLLAHQLVNKEIDNFFKLQKLLKTI